MLIWGKKLAFEKLEQLQSQLPKQPAIKDYSLNHLQNQYLGYNKLNADLQAQLDAEAKVRERLEKNLADDRNNAETLTKEKKKKDDALKALQDKYKLAQQELVEKEKKFKEESEKFANAENEIATLMKQKEADAKVREHLEKNLATLKQVQEESAKQMADLIKAQQEKEEKIALAQAQVLQDQLKLAQKESEKGKTQLVQSTRQLTVLKGQSSQVGGRNNQQEREKKLAQTLQQLEQKEKDISKREKDVAQKLLEVSQKEADAKKRRTKLAEHLQQDVQGTQQKFRRQAMPATTVRRSPANVKSANQELAELQQKIAELQHKIAMLQETNKQLLRNPSSANKVIADNSIKRFGSLNDLTKNISEKKQIESEVVTLKNPIIIQKESPAKVASPVKIVKRTRVSNVLIERGHNSLKAQNIPQPATLKQSTTEVIDPKIVKKATAVAKSKILVPAATRMNNVRSQPYNPASLTR